MTRHTRTDAGVWLDVRRTDQAHGVWKAPERLAVPPTVGQLIGAWSAQHPSARPGTKEFYTDFLRIAHGLGRVSLRAVTPSQVCRWHFELRERLAAYARRCREVLLVRGGGVSTASVWDGQTRQVQAFRWLRTAMATALADRLIAEQKPTRRQRLDGPAGVPAGWAVVSSPWAAHLRGT